MPLLIKDNKVDLIHDKYFKDLAKGQITISEQIYTLSATDNKRELIVNDNQLVETRPYVIDHSKEIKSRINLKFNQTIFTVYFGCYKTASCKRYSNFILPSSVPIKLEPKGRSM